MGILDCGGRAQRRHRFSTADRASKAAWRFASRRSPKRFGCGYAALRIGVFVVRFVQLKSGAGRSLPFGVILFAREKTNQTDCACYFPFTAVAGRGRDYFSATVFVRGQRAGEG
jgi:hypothetical protein